MAGKKKSAPGRNGKLTVAQRVRESALLGTGMRLTPKDVEALYFGASGESSALGVAIREAASAADMRGRVQELPLGDPATLGVRDAASSPSQGSAAS